MGKLFGTDGVRGKANQGDMTVETATRLGRGVAFYFKEQAANDEVRPTIVIGRDPRLSGPMLEAALTAGICSAGVDVRLLGVVPTPAVAQATVQSGAVAGLVVSASHNPFFDNGIKVFKGDGFKLSDKEEEAIEELSLTNPVELPVEEAVGTVFHLENALEQYIDFCRSTLPAGQPLAGLKLVLDCSNGATSACAEAVFCGLGATVEVIHSEPDGININDQCGSQHTEDLCAKVVEMGADAGLAFDGDGDRLIAVDEKGNELTGDQIMAICAKSYKATGDLKNNRVVATVMSNVGFHAAMRALDIQTDTAGVGDRQVLELMRRNDAVLGGEDSGHMIFLDCHTTGDGIVSALKLMQVLGTSGKTLSELSGVMTPFPQKLINVDVKEKPPIETVEGIVAAVSAAEIELGESGRVLIRYSGTQPMCRVMVEGPTMEQTCSIAERLADVVAKELG
ncbi:MAG: phosphoglucosamine mutase [Kiritimatiellales bacterium]|nr:phosphoglucosamine mutase [Kiritimatiellales bacterium]